MNELEIFNNPEFGQIRATELNGEPYFVGKDLIRAALKQSEDPEWQEKYDKAIRTFPDPNRRKV